MKITTIEHSTPQTLCWQSDRLIDWVNAGETYTPTEERKILGANHLAFYGEGAIASECGQYVFLFQRLGTKGLLLKNGEIIREINRSYYYADTYEYPAAFVTHGGRTYLIHCPQEYNRLDFEDAETGEIVTNAPNRSPEDFFHSRLEVSADNKYLLSKGWVWHPMDSVELFDIDACFNNPHLLDTDGKIPGVRPADVCSASFIDNDKILLCTVSDNQNRDGTLAIWRFKEQGEPSQFSIGTMSNPVKINGQIGNVFAIDENHCWDLYAYPKIIDLTTGEIIDKAEDIDSGQQASSIIHHLKNLPKIAFNPKTKELAITQKNKILILSIS